MSFGLIIILVVSLGYLSNWLNWRYLNYRFTHFMYYIGAFVHESSHAVLCIFTGARIQEFSVFSSQPHVLHSKSKLPLIGNFLISSAPLFGGLCFLYIINHVLLADHFSIAALTGQWSDIYRGPLDLLAQMRPWEWQMWVMVILFLNIGAMIGPSIQDIKNVWIVVILAFFIQSPILVQLGLIAVSLILVNIVLQLICISILKLYRILRT